MTMKKLILHITIVLLIPMIVGGCSKLKHMNELLTLKALSEQTEEMDKYVEEQGQDFEKLIEKVNNNELLVGVSSKKIQKKYGDPIMVTTESESGQYLERWIYRYAVKYFDSDKVYLYFDQEGKLVKSVYEPYTRGKVKKE